MTQSTTSRKSYLDIIRLIAITLVVLNHTPTLIQPFFPAYVSESILHDYVRLFIAMCDGMAVPLFFFISGALLLNKEENYQVLLKKRVFPWCILMLLFFIIEHLYLYLTGRWSFSVFSFLYNILNGTISGAYVSWFFYAYLGFLLSLPFLRLLAKHMNNHHYLYLCILYLLISAYSPIQHQLGQWFFIANWQSDGKMMFLYLFVGHFLENRLDIREVRRRHLLYLSLLSLISLLVSCTIHILHKNIGGHLYYESVLPCFRGCILIPCITFYLYMKKWYVTCPPHACISSFISYLSGGVLTIMLLEHILREQVMEMISPYIYAGWGRDILIVLSVCFLGCSIGLLLKKIPGFRSIL